MAKYIFVTGGVVSSLGKGIAALIPDVPQARPGVGSELPLKEIHANPLQPRRRFPEASLEELVESIRQLSMAGVPR